MPQQLSNGMTLLDGFPFDSNPDLITDVNGYLMGDRSVDAWTMREAFKQFFSNGVFGTPSDAWQIAKGPAGLTVTVQPGMAVIEGAMGGVEERNGPVTLTLDTQTAAGNLCYGVFLRYDDNSDVRGLTLNVKKGTAGASPTPPEPDTTSANVYELRLGYVTVPNGASDLSNATVTNEKGLAVCPYAAPFEEIDLDQIVSDAKSAANESLVKLLAEFDTYRDAISAALSDEEATYLQSQINEINQKIEDFGIDFSTEVDDATIEYASDNYPTIPKKLRVKAGGIGADELADGSVNVDKLVGGLSWLSTPSGGYLRKILVGGQSAPEWKSIGDVLGNDTQLWTGSWEKGSITCNGINDYSLLSVTVTNKQGTRPVKALCVREGQYVSGMCGSQKEDSGYFVISFRANGSSLSGMMQDDDYNTQYHPAGFVVLNPSSTSIGAMRASQCGIITRIGGIL